jgi:hypothetical protein
MRSRIRTGMFLVVGFVNGGRVVADIAVPLRGTHL